MKFSPAKAQQLAELAKHDLTAEEVGRILFVKPEDVYSFVQRNYKCGWKEYKHEQQAGLRRRLVNVAISQALSGENNTMLIFCLKNLCGWADKKEVSGPSGKEIQLKYSIENL